MEKKSFFNKTDTCSTFCPPSRASLRVCRRCKIALSSLPDSMAFKKYRFSTKKINEKSETVFEVFFVVTRRKRGSLTVFLRPSKKRHFRQQKQRQQLILTFLRLLWNTVYQLSLPPRQREENWKAGWVPDQSCFSPRLLWCRQIIFPPGGLFSFRMWWIVVKFDESSRLNQNRRIFPGLEMTQLGSTTSYMVACILGTSWWVFSLRPH